MELLYNELNIKQSRYNVPGTSKIQLCIIRQQEYICSIECLAYIIITEASIIYIETYTKMDCLPDGCNCFIDSNYADKY